jgi:DNA-binding transcriptional regulator WhiA
VSVTTDAKNELSRVALGTPQLRGAEVSALVRLTDGLHVGAHGVVVEVQVDHEATARRVQRTMAGSGLRPRAHHGPVAGRYRPPARPLRPALGRPRRRGRGPPNGSAGPSRTPGHRVAHTSGGRKRCGRRILVAWGVSGALVLNGRTTALNVLCPGIETALALVGAARRLGINARRRDVSDQVWVTVRNAEATGELLDRMGAPHAGQTCNHHQQRPSHPDGDAAHLLVQANARRSARAAAETTARVQWALAVLGEHVPEHLEVAGRLRIEHPTASLEELSLRCDPPMSKDAMAGRLRRLISTAERVNARIDARAST